MEHLRWALGDYILASYGRGADVPPWDGMYDCDTSGRVGCDRFMEVKEETKQPPITWLVEYKVYSFLGMKYKGRRYKAFVKTLDNPAAGDLGIVIHKLNGNFKKRYEVVQIVNCHKALPGKEFSDVVGELISHRYSYKSLLEGRDKVTINTLEEHGIPHVDIEGVRYVVRDLGNTKGDDDMIVDTNSVTDKVENTMLDNLFRKVENVVLDLQSGTLGIKNGSSTVTYKDGATAENPLNFFNIEFPAFAMSTPLEDIKIGDILVNSEGQALGWITEIFDFEGAFQVQNASGMTSKHIPSTNVMMGGKRTMIVKDFFGDSSFGGIQGAMLPLMFMNGGAVDANSEKVFQMLMLQSSGIFGGAMDSDGGNNMMSMMVPMLMMKNLF